MGKIKTIDDFFKRSGFKEKESKRQKASTSEQHPRDNDKEQENQQEEQKENENQPESPAKRIPMWEYPVNLREEQEILSILANRVRKHINSELGDGYFCVMVDVSRDESKNEQMAIVLRFVDVEGSIQERFLDLVYVEDTFSLTLKTTMWRQLLRNKFDVSKIRSQFYDGASNMRKEWNGLQALVLEDCPYAYYVHSFAHGLQLALVAASSEAIPVHQFFSNLVFIINVVCSSSERHDELIMTQADEIKKLLKLSEINSEKRLNQVGTLRRADDTRWGSHFNSVCSLLKMFDVTRVALEGIIEDVSHTTAAQRGDADAGYAHLNSFEFVFILHLIKEVMGKSDTLSQALQRKSQDIFNFMELVSSTKAVLIISKTRDGIHYL